MPTSLVSTGVQFPDSTIQTTAAAASFPLTLVNSTTITSSTSFYEQTGLSSYSNYILYIYFLNCGAGNPGGWLLQSNSVQTNWAAAGGSRVFMPNNGTNFTTGTDVGNRVWTNSGDILYFYMTMKGFGTNLVQWTSQYFSAADNYGWQQGYSSAGGATFTGFRLAFPSAATTGIIQLYRRG